MNGIPAWRRHSSLLMLGLVAALSYIDRQAITVVQTDIAAEFTLNDTQIGLISGLGFALIYGLAALPIARFADRHDRAHLIGGSVVFWSIATAACGLVGNAWHLAAARMTMAVGESGASPASLALMTDLYSKRRRGLVIGYFQAANAVGLSMGVVLAAWLASFMDWRGVFLALGLPGILLGAIALVLVVEPRRGGGPGAAHAPMPVGDVIRTVVGAPALRWVALLCFFVPMAGFGFLMWGNSFLERVHGYEKADLRQFGYAILVGLVAGNLAAGWASDRFGQHSASFKGGLAAFGLVAAFPFALGFAFVPDPVIALFCFVGLKFFMTLFMAPIIALCCDLVPAAMRATMIAMIGLMMIVNGQGIGTTVVGMMSDAYTQMFGDVAVRYALATISVNLLLGAVCAYMAGQAARQTLDRPAVAAAAQAAE